MLPRWLIGVASWARLNAWRGCLLASALAIMPAAWATPIAYLTPWGQTADATVPTQLQQTPSWIPKKGGTFRLSTQGTFDNLNPFAKRGVAVSLTQLLYEPLGENVGAEDSYSLRALIAQSFEVAPDHQSMIVTLRPHIRFWDGSEATSDDLIATYQALVTQAAPLYRQYYKGVARVEKLDRLRVRFVFTSNQNRTLPALIAQLPILSAQSLQHVNLGEPLYQPLMGTGPYQITSVNFGDEVTLQRQRHYWGVDLPFNVGRFNFDTITLTYFRDKTVRRQAFLSGELDYYVEMTIKDWHQAYDVPAVREGKIERAVGASYQTYGFGGIFMNMRRPLLADIRVRQALTTLFDFESLNRTQFYQSYVRTASFWAGSDRLEATDPMPAAEAKALAALVGPQQAQAYEKLPQLSGWTRRQRIERALALFESAGWHLKAGQLVNAQSTPLRLSLLLNSPSLVRLFSLWAQDLQRVGITLDFKIVDQTQFVSRLRRFDFDLAYTTIRQSSQPGREQANIFSSKVADIEGSRNYAGLKSAAVDTLIDRLSNAQSDAALTTDVHLLDRLLRLNYIAIPAWYSPKVYIAWAALEVAPPSRDFTDATTLDLTRWYCVPCQKEGAGGAPK